MNGHYNNGIASKDELRITRITLQIKAEKIDISGKIDI